MAAVLTLGISSAPGWREMRCFALCALLGALFNLSNIGVTLDVPEPLRAPLGRFSIFFGALHVTAWVAFTRAQAGARMTRLDRAMVAGGVVIAALALVPDVLQTTRTYARPVPWLAVVYRDVAFTPLGAASAIVLCSVLALLFVRQVGRWRRRERHSTALMIALGTALLGTAHDTLAEQGVLQTPYLLDEVLLVLVLAIGGTIVSRFVASARQLESTVARLEATQQELVRSERLAAVGEVAAVVAHEIRNPLAVVFNATAGLRKSKVGSEDAERLLAIVQEEAERLRDIVSDLTDFARPHDPSFAGVDLRETVRGAARAATVEAGQPDDVADIGVDPDLPSAIVCDEKLVRRAVINLVTNALQASGRRGPVHVTVRTSARGIAIAVTDDGAGVPADLAPKIFAPFFTTRPTGTGLGLVIVQRCAEAHGGRVEVDAPGERGARFTLYLPTRT